MHEPGFLPHYAPYIRIATHSRLPLPWAVPEREIWDYEILFLQEGRLHVTVEDKTYEGLPGDIFFFKPRQRHSIRALDGTAEIDQPHIHFDLTERPDSPELSVSFKMPQTMTDKERAWFRDDELSAEPWPIPNHIRPRYPERFQTILFELIEEFQRKQPMYEISCRGLLLSLLASLLRYGRQQEPSSGADMLAIREYLYLHGEREVTLDELSGMFNLSKYYMVRAYKKAFGKSPVQHHKLMRLDKAKQLLRFSNLTVQLIADQLGFGSIHAFSRAFKMSEGLSPMRYRHSPGAG